MASVMEDARSRRNSAQIASALYAKQMVNRSEAELVRLTAEADEAEADLRRIGADRDTRQNRSQNIGALVTRLEDFIGDLPRGAEGHGVRRPTAEDQARNSRRHRRLYTA